MTKMVRTKFPKKKLEPKIKPKVELVGQDNNIYVLVGLCSRALKKAGQFDEAKEMQEKIFKASSYDNALCILMDYCDIF